MKYELVKYKYGTVKRYTAFCLTLKYPKPKTVGRGGKEWHALNAGPSWRGAKHFEKARTAQEYLIGQKQDWTRFDWSLLPGTEERK